MIINKSDRKSEADLNLLQVKIEQTLKQNSISYEKILRFSNITNIDALIELIGSVKERKHSEIISEIKQKLEQTIKIKKDELKNEKNTQKQINIDDDIVKDNLKIIEGDVLYNAEKIDKLVRFEESFWSKDYYKITQSDYVNFKESLDDISHLSSQITSQSEAHSEIIKEQLKVDGNIQFVNYKLKNLESANKTFIGLVKNYNPNLLN